MRRTAMVAKPKPSPGPKPKKCANRACRAPYMPDPKRPFLNWCCDECALAIALDKLAKQKRAKQKVERADDKKKLDAYKSIPDLKAEAQVVFNRWVRMRDELEERPCICCDRMPTGGALTGGAWDAAHYRSRGSADHLRYDERNVFRSMKNCNTYGHTDYRGGLIRRIGLEAVEALECDNTIIKWTREMLEEIKARYTAKIKELKKAMK